MEAQAGIDRVQWQRRLTLGEVSQVAGTLSGGTLSGVTASEAAATSSGAAAGAVVRLTGPGGTEGEVETAAPGAFTLQARPKREGLWLYHLSVEVGGTRVEETLDLEVVPRDPPRVLWLEGAPGFESRRVKRWLTDLGGALVLRSRVSRGRYRHESANHEAIAVERLAPELLRGFDVLVVDPSGWEDLTPAERTWARQAVAAGLGALLLPGVEGETPDDPLWRSFAAVPIDDLDDIEVRLSGPGLAPLEPLVIAARHLEAAPSSRPLLFDASGRWLAAVAGFGEGRVARSLVGGTHRWALRGATASHHLYWRRLLEAVARVEPRAAAWSLPPGPVLRDLPLTVKWIGEAPAPAWLQAPSGVSEPLAPEQDPLEPSLWQATLWPRETGWHRIESADGTAAFHVLPAAAWTSWQQRQASDATRHRAAFGPPIDRQAGAAPGAAVAAASRPWPRWPLFLLLLAAWAALWAHEQWTGPTGQRPGAAPLTDPQVGGAV
jgi:hypothetical protein